MKKIVGLLIIVTILASCGNNKSGNMKVNGNIDGLKKGTLYLQKYVDTLLVSVDSVSVNGESNFILSDNVESPEIYFLMLNNIEDEKITFFGEKGEITINSKLEKFATSAKISGSKNQDILNEYEAMMVKFNGAELDFIKDRFEAQKEDDQEAFLEIQKKESNLIKRKYYYTTNFAIQHKNKEVAPYIALTELYYANIKLLDTVNNSLTKKIKASKYGAELDRFVTQIKDKEK
ncbi:DUF4369 domain-containing protein [uncultured Lutibacter sp.]|uniref:DUF4369 domain-containing protein n=1 Tax=uncultured Lutibacter sp. TaxID=437739 RepID=UPI002629617D|nr:DUF4369 domain-containing protein [uncultured Lutibacter sp.]